MKIKLYITKMAEVVRLRLRNWLLGDLINKINLIGEIESHLSSMKALADFVSKREEQKDAAERVLLADAEFAARELSDQEIDEQLENIATAKMVIMEQPAFGTKEIIEKNKKLGELEDRKVNLLRLKNGRSTR